MKRMFAKLCWLTVLCGATVLAQVPPTLGYSGRLLKASGAPETGTVQLTFVIYDSMTGGSALWIETKDLVLSSEGLYSTQLGSNTAIPQVLFPVGGSLWLEVRVASTALTPRQAIGSVAFAHFSRSVKGGTADVVGLKVNGQDLLVNGRLATAFGYQAGSGINIDGSNSISLLSCTSQNQVLVWDTGTSAWKCGSSIGPAGPSGPTGPAGAIGPTGSAGVDGAGIGQTWQNVTASRAVNTTYTNSTAKPMFFSVYGSQSAAGASFNLYVSGQLVAAHQAATAGQWIGLLGGPVPPGATYSATTSSGTIAMSVWNELR